jgi:hypothetical protein
MGIPGTRQMPPPIATNTRTPDVNPCHHCHLDLVVASAPPCRLVVVILPLYTRCREGESPVWQEGQQRRISWRPVIFLWKRRVPRIPVLDCSVFCACRTKNGKEKQKCESKWQWKSESGSGKWRWNGGERFTCFCVQNINT